MKAVLKINGLAFFAAVFLASVFPYHGVYPESSGSASLQELIAECLKDNPQIQAAQQRYEAAKARITLLRSLDDPRLEYEYDKITAGMDALTRGDTSPMRTFAVSQGIPFPTKLFLRKQAAEKDAKVFEQEYKETQRRLIKELKEAYIKVFLDAKKIDLAKANLQLLSGFVDIANKKYAVNKTGQQDSLKAQVEYSRLANQLTLLEQEEKIALSLLSSILNRKQDLDPAQLQEIKSSALEFDEATVVKAALENRPQLKSFKAALRKSQIDLALAKQEYFPDIMLKYKRQERNGGMGAWSGMVGVSVPLWFWDKQRSMVKEASADSKAMEAEYQAEENTVLFEVRSAYAGFEAAKNLVKIYETGVLPQAQAVLDTAAQSYQADKISFLDLLDSFRSSRDFQMEYFQALADLEMALADLERSTGTDFQ